MKVKIYGAGYVGLVTAAGFAETGHIVTVVEKSEETVTAIKKKGGSFFEPNLKDVIFECLANHSLQVIPLSDDKELIDDIIIIAVGTPSNADGSANTEAVFAVVEHIAKNMRKDLTIVIKSTVPIGTNEKIYRYFETFTRQSSLDFSVNVVSMPEFLKEGQALQDFRRPDRIVIGLRNSQSVDKIVELFSPFSRISNKFVYMNPESAELVKYASNAMLATRISFMNEIAAIAKRVGANMDDVRLGVGSDNRIGPNFLYSGAGFGGSCFPKDLKELVSFGTSLGTSTNLLSAVVERNVLQIDHLLDSIVNQLSNLEGKVITLWGITFKPNTDDVRDSQSIKIASLLLNQGAIVHAFDPMFKEGNQGLIGDDPLPRLHFFDNQYDALNGSSALLLMTEWNQFKRPDLNRIAKSMSVKYVFDARGVLNSGQCTEAGITYESFSSIAH
jgi:UDPglucose 6-dehydrogenase